MFTIEVKVTGLKEVRRKMERLGSSIYDFKEEFDSIGRDVVAYYKGPGFASQGGVFGNKWQRLSVPYMRRKAKRYPGRPTLIATGAMQQGFEHTSTKQSTTITNSDKKFKFHQSTRPRKVIPRRQMMGVNQTIRQMVQKEISAGLRKKIDKA